MHLRLLRKILYSIRKQILLQGNRYFARNLCLCSLYRYRLFTESGLTDSIFKALNKIQPRLDNLRLKLFAHRLPSTEMFNEPLDWTTHQWYLEGFLESAVASQILKTEALLSGIPQVASKESMYRIVSDNWEKLIGKADSEEERQLLLRMIKAYRNDNIPHLLKAAQEWEYWCKSFVSYFWYLDSLGKWSWSQKKRSISSVISYFRGSLEKPLSPSMEHQLNDICKTLSSAKNEREAVVSIARMDLSAFPMARYVLSVLIEKTNELLKKWRERYIKCVEEDDEMDAIKLLLAKEEEVFIFYENYWQQLLRYTVLSTIVHWDYLDRSHNLFKDVVKYVLNNLDFMLEALCYRSAFGRNAYALRKHELLDILFKKLDIRKDDNFLDLFANVPISSWIACLIGAKVYMVDSAFVETTRFATYQTERKKKLEQIVSDIRLDPSLLPTDIAQLNSLLRKHFDFSRLPQGGIGSKNEVVPDLLRFVSTCKIFEELVRKNPPSDIQFTFDDHSPLPQEIPRLSKNYVSKALIDPPYGYRTGTPNFGPDDGIRIAKLALKETRRVLQHNGKLVLTLPSLRWEKEGGFPSSNWRQQVLEEARNLGFRYDASSIREGRALLLLHKVNAKREHYVRSKQAKRTKR